MVRVYGEASFLYKIWHWILQIWEILMLFMASWFSKDPRYVDKKDAQPLRAGPSNKGSGGGGGPGSGGGGGGFGGNSGGGSSNSNDRPQFRPGRNIRGLNLNRNTARFPMGGG
ncbi:UNKNOWN [Stylonychia lemnae]|uniref:Uncharacterized protein n=1 Tax=Stylonychia lemnae TaxID=5949 RepID=A0A078AX31_STYLE|nr:UNKNOWN [Stylonychia lemnae]|eukprot:CDW87000.1 UNKNOWN [Stylonychia lemnae]